MSDILVTLERISKTVPDKTLFEESSFGIHKEDRIGLIGVNGCGKSTFLRILCGEEPPDTGLVTPRNGLRIGRLTQIPDIDPEMTAWDHLYLSDHADFRLLRQYNHLVREIEQRSTPELVARQQELQRQIEVRDAWRIEVKARSFLSKLGVTRPDEPTRDFSGGERRRIDLARVLMDNPDLLILDEPTNHLDIETIEWLQQYLKSYHGAMIFVTHDRYFLDDVCNRIMEIDEGVIRFYPGSYSAYLQRKQQEKIDLARKQTRRQAQLQKELKWLQRGAKARTSKPKDHVQRVKELIDKSYLSDDRELDISFRTHRLGKTILELNAVTKSYDRPLISHFSHIFQKQERIGIIGANGCGKTTLLRMITGEEEPDAGKIKVGVNTSFAYFRQETADFERDISVGDYIREQADNIRTADGTLHSTTEMLERFLFPPKMQQSRLRSLSGGERKRLYLLRSLMFGSNFLILDEPTNDLDISTLEILEDYLDAYKGCLLVVSHDRFFLDRVCDTLFVFEKNGIRKFPGNYSDYLLVRRFTEEEEKESASRGSAPQRVRTQKKLSYKEGLELADLEKRIDGIESRQKELTLRLERDSVSLTPEDYRRISLELEQNEQELERLLERWEELESKYGE